MRICDYWFHAVFTTTIIRQKKLSMCDDCHYGMKPEVADKHPCY